MNRLKGLSLLFLSVVLATGCSPEEPTPQPAEQHPLTPSGEQNKTQPEQPALNFKFSHAFKLKTSFDQLTDEQLELYVSIHQDKTANYKTVSKALIDLHYRLYDPSGEKKSTSMKELEELLNDTLANTSLPTSDNLSQLKVQYESRLERILGQPIQYYGKAYNLFDLPQAQLQCYSGTVLNQIIINRLTQDIDQFASLNNVLIYTPGHILPGYVVTRDDQHSLYGIETTVSGQGLVDYGLIKDINLPIRIVDSNLWSILELFKFDMTKKSRTRVAKAVLIETAKKYGVPLKRLETLVKQQNGIDFTSTLHTLRDGAETAQVLNSSPLAFGRAEVPEQPVSRKKTDNIDPVAKHNQRIKRLQEKEILMVKDDDDSQNYEIEKIVPEPQMEIPDAVAGQPIPFDKPVVPQKKLPSKKIIKKIKTPVIESTVEEEPADDVESESEVEAVDDVESESEEEIKDTEIEETTSDIGEQSEPETDSNPNFNKDPLLKRLQELAEQVEGVTIKVQPTINEPEPLSPVEPYQEKEFEMGPTPELADSHNPILAMMHSKKGTKLVISGVLKLNPQETQWELMYPEKGRDGRLGYLKFEKPNMFTWRKSLTMGNIMKKKTFAGQFLTWANPSGSHSVSFDQGRGGFCEDIQKVLDIENMSCQFEVTRDAYIWNFMQTQPNGDQLLIEATPIRVQRSQ